MGVQKEFTNARALSINRHYNQISMNQTAVNINEKTSFNLPQLLVNLNREVLGVLSTFSGIFQPIVHFGGMNSVFNR